MEIIIVNEMVNKQVQDVKVFHLVCKIKCSKYTAGMCLNWVSSTWSQPSTQTTTSQTPHSTSNRGGGCLCLQCFGVEWSSRGRFQGMWSLQTSIVLPATPPSHIWGMTSAPSWSVGLLSEILLLSHFRYWKHFTVSMSAKLCHPPVWISCFLPAF